MAGLIISSSGDHTAADHAYETAIYVAKDAVRLAPDNSGTTQMAGVDLPSSGHVYDGI
jgi:hypothetical protein